MSSVSSSSKEWGAIRTDGVFPPSTEPGGAVRFRQGSAQEARGRNEPEGGLGQRGLNLRWVSKALRKVLYVTFLMPPWPCIMRICLTESYHYLKSFSLVARGIFTKNARVSFPMLRSLYLENIWF